MQAATEKRPRTTTAMVKMLHQSEQDFEWYPTTEEIISCVRADMVEQFAVREKAEIYHSILDCGAGDGRVLDALTAGRKYAIEKALPLLNALSEDIFVVGTDFDRQTLLDKRVDCVFSNPPYSRYGEWSAKIINEAAAKFVYLVIPERWQSNAEIAAALAARKARTEIIGEYDFLNAERAARAKVHVLRVSLTPERYYHYSLDNAEPAVDPFDLWFDRHFDVAAPAQERSDYEKQMAEKSRVQRKLEGCTQLVTNHGLVHVLEQLYHRDLQHLMGNYQRVAELDADLLLEMGFSVRSLKGALRLKVASLKDIYWQELFDNLKTVTERLTSATRKQMLERLFEHTCVDFSAENAHAIVMWVLKNANHYYDTQLIQTVENMVNAANVAFYKSNKRTFGQEQWRYGRVPEGLERYGLEYRIVLHHVGGVCNSSWSFENTNSGLTKSASEFINDLRTVATNIGFDTYGTSAAEDHHWVSNGKVEFVYRDLSTGDYLTLMEARAFKNGNLHLKLNQAFIRRLNVEFGRLKGWLKDAQEAADEMGISVDEARNCFASNLKLTARHLPLLGAPAST